MRVNIPKEKRAQRYSGPSPERIREKMKAWKMLQHALKNLEMSPVLSRAEAREKMREVDNEVVGRDYI